MESLKSLFEMPFSARQRRLAASRPPLSKDDFIAKIASDDRGRGAAALLWDKLNAAKVREELSPYPDDDLLRVYGLADEDLDEDIILAIIRDVGVPVPDREMLASFGQVSTPSDIVRLIEKCGE